MKHARLTASAAERWMNCAGSVTLAEKTPPPPPSFPAAQGTYAHDLAAWGLTTGKDVSALLGQKATVEGHPVECDQEMVEGVQLYLDTARRLTLEKRWVELTLTDSLVKWDDDLGGTADYATYSPASKLLRVMDFKYGAGVFVSADDNRQLKIYAFGAMLAVNAPVETVEVYIVQPRYEGADAVRMQSFPAHDLMDFAGDIAHAAIATRLPDAPLTPGSWCTKTFCPNARVCPALEAHTHLIVKQDFTDVVAFDVDKLAAALTSIPLVEARMKAIKEFAYSQALQGRDIPGYKLVEKRPRRCWVDEKQIIKWAQDRAIDPFEEPTLKSPAQLEKGLKKAEKSELAGLVISVSSGTTLVPAADVRAGVSKQITVDEFDVVPR